MPNEYPDPEPIPDLPPVEWAEYLADLSRIPCAWCDSEPCECV